MLRVLGLVLARGGSKGIPRKNICLVGGKPLLTYTAEAALAARRLTRTIVSTDDQEIAEVARRSGLDVPFMRPSELARDDTPSLPVVQHAVGWLEAQGERFDAICQLQPTTPFRPAAEIDRCIELFEQAGADCAMTVARVPDEYNPHWVYFRQANGTLHLSSGEGVPIPRRQLLPPAYHRDGSVYVTRRDAIMIEGSLYGSRVVGLFVESEGRVNIDVVKDLERAEALLRVSAAGTGGVERVRIPACAE